MGRKHRQHRIGKKQRQVKGEDNGNRMERIRASEVSTVKRGKGTNLIIREKKKVESEKVQRRSSVTLKS